MNEIPVAIAKYLTLENITEEVDIHDLFAYLIKSRDGDAYYLGTELPERGIISKEFGEIIYDIISNGYTNKEILKWYSIWMKPID